MDERVRTRQGATVEVDEARAVQELSDQLAMPGTSAVAFFCSPRYDLARLASCLRGAFDAPLIGCTTAGQIGLRGFQPAGITAVALASPELKVTPHAIWPLSGSLDAAKRIAAHDERRSSQGTSRAFGVLLVDGLSLRVEGLTAALYQALGQVPIVGGSAGDDLAFERTHVFADGEFRSDAAVFALFETTLPFTTFKLQHFVPGPRRLVITAADAATRLVREICGRPAAETYAEALGIPLSELGPATFSRRPLVLRLGDDVYVRSVQRVHEDGSLSFLCAIDEGIVVRIGEAVDPVTTVSRAFEDVRSIVPKPEVVLGCDCILRRIELEERGVAGEVARIYADNHVVGFNTYGEQFNAAHVNQTFTGVAIGG